MNKVWFLLDRILVAKIRDGAVNGAISLVNSDIANYGIAVGIPAKVIKNIE